MAQLANPPKTQDRPTQTFGPLAGLSLTVLLPSLATSTANMALPALAQAFAVPFQAAQWIVLGFLVTVTALSVAVGRIADGFGRRRLLLAGIAGFVAASLLCGMAPGFGPLVAARVLQGAAAAVMMALPMAFLGEIMPPSQTGRAMGLLGSMSAIGTTLGPALGGVLVALAGPRAIFLVNVPLGLLAFVLVRRALPADRRATTTERAGIDLPGMALLAVALTAYALAMTLGRGHFGWANAVILLTAVIAAAGFLAVEARTAAPLVRLGLLCDRVLGGGLAANAAVSTVMMATLVVGPFYLAGGLGLDAASAGLVLSAGPLVAALVGIPAGRMVDRFGSGRTAVAGLLAIAAGTFALALASPAAGVAGYLLPVVAMTAGYAVFQAANNTAIMAGAGSAERGVVSGMLSLSRNLGLINGASAMGTVFAFGAGGRDVATAGPAAVAAGTHVAFTVAALLIVAVLAFVLRARR